MTMTMTTTTTMTLWQAAFVARLLLPAKRHDNKRKALTIHRKSMGRLRLCRRNSLGRWARVLVEWKTPEGKVEMEKTGRFRTAKASKKKKKKKKKKIGSRKA